MLSVWHRYTLSRAKEYRVTRLARAHYHEMLLRNALQRWGEYVVCRRSDKVSVCVVWWVLNVISCFVEENG